MLDPRDRKTAEDALGRLLRGAQLDSFQVRWVDVTLCFLNLDPDDRPGYLWLWTAAPLRVCDGDLTEWPPPPAGEAAFLEGRAGMLPDLYRLIGDSIAALALAPGGGLSLSFTRQSIVVLPRGREADEVWSVTDRTPGTFDAQGWRIALADNGTVTVKQPAR